jgi:hypothetical protein
LSGGGISNYAYVSTFGGEGVSNYAEVSTFQGQRYQITLRSVLLSGGGISDYADVSNFGGEGYQVTHFAAAKAQSQQFWRGKEY